MNDKLKIYTDRSVLRENNLKNLNPLLSRQWKNLDEQSVSADERAADSPFDITMDPENADFVVMPMHWSYYLWNDKAKMDEARRLADIAKANNKKIIIWYKGDLIPLVPFENALVFLPGMIKSKARSEHRACPAFVPDPKPVFGKEATEFREKREIPSVGFCGYAAINTLKTAWSIFQGIRINARTIFGGYDYEGVTVIPATLKRRRALEHISIHPKIEANFVIRDKHTADQIRKKSLENGSSSHVFYSNIYDSDYTLCVRGYGNWSYRFYETLACGRIPVFIDTDCVLPAAEIIDWRKYCVWVDESELRYIGEKILDFHSDLSPTDFIDLQIACRKLWKTHLTLDGFIQNVSHSLRAELT